MAILGSTFFDLVDLYKRQDETLEVATIIEMLMQTNEILNDAVAMEANQGTKHRTTVRTGLPDVTWGRLYKGISQSKSATQQVEDTTGFAEALSTIDKRLLDISGNPNAVRLSEAQGFIEAMNQEVADKLFYGDDVTTPEEFMGFAERFDDLSAQNGGQIVDGGGTGADNTSVWFIMWGDNQSHLIYPSGTRAGLQRDDKGEQRVTDSNGDPYYAVEELFRWHVGLTVRDWRYVARIANIDVSELRAGNVDIFDLMRKAFWKLRSHAQSGGRLAIYANSDILEALDADSTPTKGTSGSFVRLTPDQQDGKVVMDYRGIPVRQVDALRVNEAQVT